VSDDDETERQREFWKRHPRCQRVIALHLARPDWSPQDVLYLSGIIELRTATDRACRRAFEAVGFVELSPILSGVTDRLWVTQRTADAVRLAAERQGRLDFAGT
jgi:hypothetical protein